MSGGCGAIRRTDLMHAAIADGSSQHRLGLFGGVGQHDQCGSESACFGGGEFYGGFPVRGQQRDVDAACPWFGVERVYPRLQAQPHGGAVFAGKWPVRGGKRHVRTVMVEAVVGVDLFVGREMPAGAPERAGLDLELVSVPGPVDFQLIPPALAPDR